MKAPIPQTLGARAKALRLRLTLETPAALAEQTQGLVSEATIKKVEGDEKYNPTLRVLKNLAAVFGVRISFLIGDTSSDLELETALYQEALAMFLKDQIVSEDLEFRLRKLARNGAGSTKPGGWKHVVDEIAPGEQLIKRFPQRKRGDL